MAAVSLYLLAYLLPLGCVLLAFTGRPALVLAACAGALVGGAVCRDVRGTILPLGTWLVASLAFFALIAAARVVGGTPAEVVVASSVRLTATWIALCVAAVLVRGLLTPSHHLRALDTIRIPRLVQYVLILPMVLLPSFIETLGRQVRLATLRSPPASPLIARFRLYRRVAIPLFLSTLEVQETLALSFSTRGFFARTDSFVSPPFAVDRAAGILASAVVACLGLTLVLICS